MALLRIPRVLCFLLLAAGAAFGAPDQQPQNVLVVVSYHVGMQWTDDVIQGLGKQLDDHAQVIITQLDIKRFPEQGREQTILDVFRAKVLMSNPVVVVTIDDYAYWYALKHRNLLPAGAPIVFGGVNFWDNKRPPGVTGVVESHDFVSALALVWRLHPEARRLVVVNDSTETGVANRLALDKVLPQQAAGRDVLFLGGGTFEETENELAHLDPARDVVLLLSWNLDSRGSTRSYDQAVEHARALCPAPLYGAWDFQFGRGIVGGVLISGRVHGEEVGGLVHRILAGENADDIPVVTHGSTRMMLDERELLRFRIPASRIPPGAEISFRRPSFWRDNARLITIASLIIALQAATISWLVFTRARRRHAEAMLRESRENLRATLDSIEEGVIVSGPAGLILRLNPAAEKMIGRSSHDSEGRPVADAVTLLDPLSRKPLAIPSLQRLLAAPASQASQRAVMQASGDAAPRQVIYTVSPMRDQAGVARGTVLVLQDITAQNRLEEQLQQSQKMESIGQFASGVAHDFNNILAVIVGHGELLSDQISGNREALDDLGMMMQGARRASDLVQQILTFSRKKQSLMAPVQLQTVTTEALKFLRSTVPSSIEITSFISPEAPPVQADATQIHQVLMNLCSNSVHAMRGGNGRLGVRLEPMHITAPVMIDGTVIAPGFYARLAISDTGHGMNAETRRRIFEPFFTTKGPGEGTGLGLSVVHGIVESHGARIIVHSEPGEGTIFELYFPALTGAVHEDLEPGEGALHHGSGECIMIVDDEPVLATAVSRIAERLGYRPEVFSHPELALQKIKEPPFACEILVTDLTMPGMSGIELITAARRVRPGLPAILITGFADSGSNQVAQKLGIQQVLTKPFTIRKFANALRAAQSPRRP